MNEAIEKLRAEIRRLESKKVRESPFGPNTINEGIDKVIDTLEYAIRILEKP